MLVQWRLADQDGVMIARQASAIYTLACHGPLLMSGTHSGVFSVFDTVSRDLVSHLQADTSPVFDIAFFNGLVLLATGHGSLLVLDQDFSLVKRVRLSEKSLRRIEPVGERIAVSGSEGIIWILDAGFDTVSRFQAHSTSVFAMAHSPLSGTLLSGGRDALLKLFRDNELLTTIPAHLLHIHGIALNHDESLYLTCSMDKTIKLWHAPDNALLKVIDFTKYGGHTSSVNKILWFDKNKFISCSDDRTLKCFEIQQK